MWWNRAKPHPTARLPTYDRSVLHALIDAVSDGPVVIPVTLLAVGICSLGALIRPRWDVALVLGLLAAIWSRVNTPVEGRILHTWSADRGFTEADLISVAAMVVVGITLLRCGWRLVRHLTRRRAAGAAPLNGAHVTR